MHCDLKPENLLFESPHIPRIKIIDLGLSQLLKNEAKLEVERGSIYYLAPEMIKKNYDRKVDIWSAGVIFYILITGVPPFNAIYKDKNGSLALDQKEIKRKILKGEVDYTHSAFAKHSLEAMRIIQKMLTYNPERRPEAQTLLEHPYFGLQKLKKINKEGSINFFI